MSKYLPWVKGFFAGVTRFLSGFFILGIFPKLTEICQFELSGQPKTIFL